MYTPLFIPLCRGLYNNKYRNTFLWFLLFVALGVCQGAKRLQFHIASKGSGRGQKVCSAAQ